MKPDATPPEDDAKALEGEPAAPSSGATPENSQEHELDELRRFRVRTVPPDMRRQWMLAETPIVSTVELQDTMPPKRAVPVPESARPRPLYNAPRVSSTAPTIRLPHVVARDRRKTVFVAVIAAAVLALIVLRDSVHRRSADSQLRPPPGPARTSSPTPELGAEPEHAGVTQSEQTEPPRIAPATENIATARETPPRSQSPKPRDRDHKAQATGTASAKIPPVKADPQPDIKSPLFGQ